MRVGEACPSLFGDRVADEEQVHRGSLFLEAGELQAGWFEEALFAFEVSLYEWVSHEPVVVESELELAGIGAHMREGDDLWIAVSVEENRETKQGAQALCGLAELQGELLEVQIVELAAVAAHQRCYQSLLVTREPRQIG